MGDVAHPAPRPVPQGKDGFATQVFLFFNEGPQDKALICRENTGSKLLLLLDLYATGWVPPQDLFVFNQPLTKMIDDRLDTGAVAHAIALLLER
jgi:hypothetical protein